MLSGKRAFKIMLAGFAVVLFAACGSEHTEQDVIIGEEQNGSATQDTTPPVITLNGEANIMLNQGEAYIEPGATASDKRDGNVSVETSGTVDTSKAGTYTITYTAIDSAGNKAQETRTVSVTISTLQLQSLNLEINVSTLNLGEQASLNVTGNYKDNTSKDLTEQVAWVISPSGSVEINGTTLTALKDTNVTLQAKVGTIVSNTLKLDIYWEVNGYRLPPEPDKVLNDSTLLGIDSNNNDVRDDVERWIYKTYKDKHPIYIDIAIQEAREDKLILKHPEKAKEIHDEVNKAVVCQGYYKYEAKYYGDPILIQEDAVDEYFRSKIYFNTKERKEAYEQYDSLLSGDSYTLVEGKEQKAMCDFNTSKYEE
ncbi:DUF5011 domain-containing protein [Sulfurovum mangrovi]|uniref:DUF5011 domain-containing protein n=1 Tax=Sulfurovum mangrovi TaxID=2893889 RepID=UPI001E613F03|nr:DUF5011 domain-containing protein [Sulfurovum mangrovi]UFH59171.1 DUF5011 domain-containing protein [Sulfurovum mangrovi]